jgi:hypothetical protein
VAKHEARKFATTKTPTNLAKRQLHEVVNLEQQKQQQM